MTCLRCQGLMVEDHLLDVKEASGHIWTTGLRCMNCGYVHDTVIEQRRRLRHAPAVVASGRKSEYQDDDGDSGTEPRLRFAA